MDRGLPTQVLYRHAFPSEFDAATLPIGKTFKPALKKPGISYKTPTSN